MTATQTQEVSLEQLLRDLNSRNAASRGAALAEARRLPPVQLLKLAKMKAEKHRQRIQTLNRFGLTLVAISCLFLAVMWATGHWSWEELRIFQIFQFSALAVALYLPRRGHQSVATLIEGMNDIRFLGAMLDLLHQGVGDVEVSKNLRAALMRLLPQFRADQAAMLTPEQRQALLVPLKSPYGNVEFTLAVLKALEQVGDEKAIPVVEQLASDGAPTANMKRVRQAARDCLPFLRQSAERQRLSETLLRASDTSTTATPDVLLRPAMPNADQTPSEQLLRAASASGATAMAHADETPPGPLRVAVGQGTETPR
jgi:hypothetical protein